MPGRFLARDGMRKRLRTRVFRRRLRSVEWVLVLVGLKNEEKLVKCTLQLPHTRARFSSLVPEKTLAKKGKKSIINYYIFSNAKWGEVWEWHLIFSVGGWSSACVVMMDEKTRKNCFSRKESINYVCLLLFSLFLFFVDINL